MADVTYADALAADWPTANARRHALSEVADAWDALAPATGSAT